jgi:hypothetical protein
VSVERTRVVIERAFRESYSVSSPSLALQ